jgi:(4S)-4-hydroxy-5-phosphonooxypentane-2,3-dione isomerase
MKQQKQDIYRIVRMEFQPDKADSFHAMFMEVCEQIRAFPGCTELRLWTEHGSPHVFYTFSHWESAGHLEEYRNSALFKATWAQTKQWFCNKPMAFSVHEKIAL